MRYRAAARWADELGVFRERAGLVPGRRLFPLRTAFLQLVSAQLDVDGSLFRIDADHVAVTDQRDRPADVRFGADVPNHQPAGRAAESAVRHQADIIPESLPDNGRCHAEHLAHAGAALGAFVADNHRVAFDDPLLLHRGHALLFAVETFGRPAKLQLLHAGRLDDAAFRRQVALEDVQAARFFERAIDRHHHALIWGDDGVLHVLAQRLAGDGQAIAI